MGITPKLFIFLFVLYQISHQIRGNSFKVSIDELSLGKPKNYTLNSTIFYVIEIKNLSNIIEKVPPRIFVKCEECNMKNPLLIVVGQNKGVLSWELPVVIESNPFHAVYKNTERTLCPYDILGDTVVSHSKVNKNLLNNIQPVTIALSTSNVKNIVVELLVNLEENFVLDLNKNKSVEVTPSTPAFYLYNFEPENVTSVLLHVTSEDDTCLMVSIQNVSCPVFDLEENVEYKGNFQTVTRQGGFTVTKEAFPDGFYVVLIVRSDNNYCSTMLVQGGLKRTKNVSISISKTISSEDYIQAIGITIAVIVVFWIAMLIIFIISVKSQNNAEPILVDEIINEDLEATTSATQNFSHRITSPVTKAPTDSDGLSIKTDSSLDETDFDAVSDAESDKNIFRMKNYLYLSDLAKKNQSVLKKKSELYFWNLLTVGIFYFLPVAQLVLTDQYHLNQSGKQDLCYYNFLCSHPLWYFSDFNHMFSNIGYISLGALFMFLVLLKQKDYKLKIGCHKKLYRSYGIPQHFGLFYSMGAALIIEGIFSLCYHICPNHYNFQFDTSFMYVICTLCMIKIYQTRHPDIYASASTTFSLLAGVIFLGMYGVFSSNLAFWILFSIVHLSTCLYLSLKIYYLGRFRLEFFTVVRWFKEATFCRLSFFKPYFPSRFCLLVVANICNWGLAIGSFVFNFKNFSSFLLTIFMVNLVLYTAFYILMKFVCKEKLPIQSVIYILLAMLCWSAALYFFFSKTISWRLSPAKSKLFNQKCKVLDFYDNHDIWHFLSAAAMFFSFMVLLTLDDDLIYVPRSQIVVF